MSIINRYLSISRMIEQLNSFSQQNNNSMPYTVMAFQDYIIDYLVDYSQVIAHMHTIVDDLGK